MQINLTINRQPVAWQVNPGEILLTVLRREGYASVKWGCGEGDCGACTVLVDGRAQRSCLLLAGQVEGRAITTAEGLAQEGDGERSGERSEPHPLQRAFVEAGAVQCGYCTPGMLLSAKALLEQNPAPSEAEVREALDGNLCRCTGYKKIIEAVLTAAERMRS